MSYKQTWQVHANAQQNGSDLALRLTVTCYGPDGSEEGQKTWRAHVSVPEQGSLTESGAQAAYEMTRMMLKALNGDAWSLTGLELDTPLF